MNNTSDQKLEELLESRIFISPRANLAERIIAAAQLQQRKHEETAIEWLQGLFRDFIVVKPAYTMLFILILGIVTGFVGTIQNSGEQSIGIHSSQTQAGLTQAGQTYTSQTQANRARGFLYIREDYI